MSSPSPSSSSSESIPHPNLPLPSRDDLHTLLQLYVQQERHLHSTIQRTQNQLDGLYRSIEFVRSMMRSISYSLLYSPATQRPTPERNRTQTELPDRQGVPPQLFESRQPHVPQTAAAAQAQMPGVRTSTSHGRDVRGEYEEVTFEFQTSGGGSGRDGNNSNHPRATVNTFTIPFEITSATADGEGGETATAVPDHLAREMITNLFEGLFSQMIPGLRLGGGTSDAENRPPTADEIERGSRRVPYSEIAHPITDTCPITYDPFLPTTPVRELVHCHHLFSEIGFDQWFRGHAHCPVCRHDIRGQQPQPQQQSPPQPQQQPHRVMVTPPTNWMQWIPSTQAQTQPLPQDNDDDDDIIYPVNHHQMQQPFEEEKEENGNEDAEDVVNME